jgi:hypothetical protein
MFNDGELVNIELIVNPKPLENLHMEYIRQMHRDIQEMDYREEWREARDEGMAKGIAIGEEQGIALGEKRLIDLLESGKTLEEAKGILGIR